MTETEAKNKARFNILTQLHEKNGLSEDDLYAVAYEAETLDTLITDSRLAIDSVVNVDIKVALLDVIANGGKSADYFFDDKGEASTAYKEADAKIGIALESIENPLLRKVLINETKEMLRSVQNEAKEAKLLKDAKDAADAVKPADVKTPVADKTDEEKARELEEWINTNAVNVHEKMLEKAAGDPVEGHDKAMLSHLAVTRNRIIEHYKVEANADTKFDVTPVAKSLRRGLGLYLESHYSADGSLTEDEMKIEIRKAVGKYRMYVENIDNPKLEPVAPAPTPVPTPVVPVEEESKAVKFMNWSANKAGKVAGTTKRILNKLRRK